MKTTKEQLRDKGIITLCGQIKEEAAAEIVQEIMYINSLETSSLKAVQMILNSCGGTCPCGFMIIDFIEYSKMPVHITGLGICASMGINILCSGTKGKRTITKNTSLLCHQYSWRTEGKYHELVAARKEEEAEHKRMIEHYLRHTNLNRRQIKEILLPQSDVWLSPKEAKKYGIVDKVIV